ncbi:MAG: tetratricopeptide repeat protein [Thermoguttaceae bacterium]|nr:tetratricopeptide repeat protein [Thermoguttaceae bacterium]MDW8079338.1 tetratricopeptide repeat protein [Thermoguttaceae bacterium]
MGDGFVHSRSDEAENGAPELGQVLEHSAAPVAPSPRRLKWLIGVLAIGVVLAAAEYTLLWWLKSAQPAEPAGDEASSASQEVLRPLADRYRGKVGDIQYEALQLADFVLTKWPDDIGALFVRGLILNKFISRDLGVACWQECIRRAPEFAEPYYWLGIDRFKRGEYAEAIDYLDKSIQLGVRLVDARVALGEAYVCVGKPEDAVRVLEEQLIEFPSHPGTHFYLAHALEKCGRLSDAERHYREVIRLQPDNYQAWHGLAMLAQRQGRKEEAAGYFEICRKYQVAFHAGHQEARRRYDDAESLATSLATAYTDVGKLFIDRGQPDEAARMWQRAVAVDKEHRESRLLLTDYYAVRREWPKAAQLLEELCALDPQNLRHRVNAGAAWMAAGNYLKAEEHFRTACEVFPDRAEGYVGLVELALVMGRDVDKAVQLAEKVVQLEPTAEHHFLLARARWAAGKAEDAVQSARRAAELDPGARRYRDLLARLEAAVNKEGAQAGPTSPASQEALR